MPSTDWRLIGGSGTPVTAASVGPAAPGNASILSVSVIDTAPDSSGNPQKLITVIYTPPTPLGTFAGIDVWLDAPDSSTGLSKADGTVPADGNTPAVGVFSPTYETFMPYSANNLQVKFIAPAPTVIQLWRIYITPASNNAQVNPVEYGQPGATPSFQIAVLAPATAASGVEFAPLVQSPALNSGPGFTPNPFIVISDSGDQTFVIGVIWNWPTNDPNYAKLGGINVIFQNNTSGIQAYPGNVTVSAAGVYTSSPINVLPGTTSYTIYLLSYDVNGNSNTLVPGVTPSVTFTVTRQNGVVGAEFTSLVVSDGVHQFAVVTPVNGADGSQLLQVDGYWQNHVQGQSGYDPTFGGAQVVLDKGDGNGPFYSVVKGTLSPIENDISQPATVQNWAFYIRSIDINGRNNTVGPLIQFSGGGGSGAVFTPIITGGVMTSATKLAGGTGYGSAPTATLVDGAGNAIAGVSLTAVLTGSAVSSITVSTGGSGIVATPVNVISVGNASGVLNLGKASASSFNAGQFAIVAGAFTVAALNANIITTGTLKIGNNGSGTPIELALYDSLGNLFGWWGQDTGSGLEGLWAKQAFIGGSSPSSAPIVADSSGNVTITGATLSVVGSPFTITISPSVGLQVTGNGITTTLDNSNYVGSPAGFTSDDGTITSAIFTRSLGFFLDAGGQISALAASLVLGGGYQGLLTLEDTGTSGSVQLFAHANTATSASGGSLTLPASPVLFWQIKVGGTTYKVPLYT